MRKLLFPLSGMCSSSDDSGSDEPAAPSLAEVALDLAAAGLSMAAGIPPPQVDRPSAKAISKRLQADSHRPPAKRPSRSRNSQQSSRVAEAARCIADELDCSEPGFLYDPLPSDLADSDLQQATADPAEKTTDHHDRIQRLELAHQLQRPYVAREHYVSLAVPESQPRCQDCSEPAVLRCLDCKEHAVMHLCTVCDLAHHPGFTIHRRQHSLKQCWLPLRPQQTVQGVQLISQGRSGAAAVRCSVLFAAGNLYPGNH